MADKKKMVQAQAKAAAASKSSSSSSSGKSSSSSSKKTATTKEMVSEGKGSKSKGLLDRIAKIDHIPKDIRSSIPVRGFMNNGIIETKPGDFTKTYKLQDINFNIATKDEQESIVSHYMDFLNIFNDKVRFQITVFNHEVDKRKTIEKIRKKKKKDGLNKYRQEMNNILLENLKNGNNSITQDKYLTICIHDPDTDHAVQTLEKMDLEILKALRPIVKVETIPMDIRKRMQVLYDVYNQDMDYRMATGIFNGNEEFDLRFIEKCGLSVKDIIGPPSMDWRKQNRFMLGDTYGQALYLQNIPKFLTSDFLADLGDVQSNMLISMTYEPVDAEHAIKLCKNQLASIDAKVAKISKRNGDDGLFMALPPELENAQKNARDLMNDITGRNQKLFLMTMVVIVFAKTEDELEERIRLVKNVASKHICTLKPLKYQQEFCLNTALPLGRNDLKADRMYTTESASVFIPFNAQEICQENAIFYGLNQITKSMILCDRLSGSNYNGLIFGFSGSGKSFTAKCEMVSVLLNHPDAQVFVIDPQGEYYPLAGAMKGQEIVLSPGSKVYINPLDLDLSEDNGGENDPITMKSDFVISMFSLILGKDRQLEPIHSSLIDKCVRRVYSGYVEEMRRLGKTFDASKCPTLGDLYEELMDLKKENYEAGYLADIISQYAVGSFDTFAHRTNVETNARFVVYNTKTLGTGMKELGLHICTNDVWNRMIANSKKNVYTWFYIDEFHVLLESASTTVFLKRVWKMARKWLGCPTGMMQNTEDLLRNADTRAIFNNTSFIIMLKEPVMDRQNLGELLGLSNAQLEYINNSDPGKGLLFNGKVTVPFMNEFPKNTELYSVMTTAHDEEVKTEHKFG